MEYILNNLDFVDFKCLSIRTLATHIRPLYFECSFVESNRRVMLICLISGHMSAEYTLTTENVFPEVQYLHKHSYYYYYYYI